jgi:hypothetical protein
MFTRTKIAIGSAAVGLVALGAATYHMAQPTDASAFDSGGAIHVAQVSGTPGPGPRRGFGPGDRPHGTPTAEQKAKFEQRKAEHKARHEAFLSSVASKLGVTSDALKNAFKQARIDQINQAVKDGKLTQERATEIINRINSGEFGPGGGPGGRKGHGGPGGQRGPGGPGGPSGNPAPPSR